MQWLICLLALVHIVLKSFTVYFFEEKIRIQAKEGNTT